MFSFRRKPRRVLVIGLDCAEPDLLFHQFRADLPTFDALMRGGTWGVLESATPCITVPAWASMLSSRDPGVLGIYGFRNRTDWTYNAMATADGTAVREPRVWDVLGDAGRESVVLNVPQTYPPRPLKGHLVSCFLTPDTGKQFAYPAVFRQEVLQVAPDYAFDVRDFRSDDKAQLWQTLLAMTEAQYRVALHALQTKPWDLFMHVNIGVDRVHHGFWRFHDPAHRLYEAGSPHAGAIRDYYRLVDSWVARLIAAAGDDAVVLVVSDHGAKRMDGGICVNEWLWQHGWLALNTPPVSGRLTRFEDADIDWTRTRAWASGGYYARVFLNIAGREPHGTIAPAAVSAVREELAAALAAIPGDHGQPLSTHVFRPQDLYQQVNGYAPDLMVYFGDLHWRAIGTLGHGRHWTFENDTGQDDANHAQDGLYILYDPKARGAGAGTRRQLMDVAPTLLSLLGVAVPGAMQGRAFA